MEDINLQRGEFMSMDPSTVYIKNGNGVRPVTRLPLRDEFRLDPVTGDVAATRMHHGEDFQPVEKAE